MKKRPKKMVLNRETIRNLQSDRLSGVAGAGPCTLEDWTTCVCTEVCNSDGTGGGSATCSGPDCPTLTIQDWSCCEEC